jgi:tyrosine-protein kinase Etk/Wzc
MQQIQNQNQGVVETIDFKTWFFQALRLWPWFVISILMSIFLAWFYLLVTEPVYESSAYMMIKDDKKGGGATLDNYLLKELNISSKGKLLENEIEVLRSLDMIEEVVYRQNLFILVKREGRFSDQALFDTDQPFKLKVFNPNVIAKELNWVLYKEENKWFLKPDENIKSISIQENKIYKIQNISFQLLPNQIEGLNNSSNLLSGSKFIIQIYNPTRIAQLYKKNLTVQQVGRQATVISMSIKDSHQSRATIFLKSLIELYNEQGLKDKNLMTSNTIDFIDERLGVVENELKLVEGQVENFKRKNRVTNVSSEAEVYLGLVMDLDKQKAEQEIKVNIVSSLENEILNNQQNPRMVPSSLGIIDPSLVSLIQEHNDILLKRNRLKSLSNNKNPGLVDLDNQLSDIRKTLLENVKNLSNSYKISLRDINGQDKRLTSKLSNIPALEKQLIEISRDRNVKEQIYLFLLQKREESAITLASTVTDSRIVEKPRGLGKVKPKPNYVYLVSLMSGFIIALLPMLLIDFFDDKVGSRREVETRCKAPLLGDISHVKEMSTPIQISMNSRSVVSEQLRSIRTGISFTGRGSEINTILISSHRSGEGKSFTSLNLAASYALLNKRVVILEFDLRKPRVLRNLGLKSEKGISNVLSGNGSVDEMVMNIEGYNSCLFVLPSGPIPPNPSELILSEKMDVMMNDLKRNFDYVIIDSPPFSLVTDAILLRKYADISLIVLRQGYSVKVAFSEINNLVDQDKGSGIYTVLNGINKTLKYSYYGAKYSYGYGYGYGYGNSYGYGYVETDKKKSLLSSLKKWF